MQQNNFHQGEKNFVWLVGHNTMSLSNNWKLQCTGHALLLFTLLSSTNSLLRNAGVKDQSFQAESTKGKVETFLGLEWAECVSLRTLFKTWPYFAHRMFWAHLVLVIRITLSIMCTFGTLYPLNLLSPLSNLNTLSTLSSWMLWLHLFVTQRLF